MVNEISVGNGKVFLLAGGGKIFTSTAAKFCRTEKDVEEIIAEPESKKLIKAIIDSRHYAALEFDDFVFAAEGYSRVTEAQLIRKRLASYMIKSGRTELHGKRSFDVTIPSSIHDVHSQIVLDPSKITLKTASGNRLLNVSLQETLPLIQKQFGLAGTPSVIYEYDYMDILELISTWYDIGVDQGIPEEDLRYMKPQATSTKIAIKMNAHALRDWAMIRMCNRAQFEIRDLCTKMIKLATEAAPSIMEGVGPSCKVLGYCPEMDQCRQCVGKIPTKDQALKFLEVHRKEVLECSEKT